MNWLSYERFMAWRYLWGARGSGEGRRFLRIITYLAVGGVAVGVAALVLSLSIVRGFSQQIEGKIAGFGAHVQVEHIQNQPLPQADTLRSMLMDFERVRDATPVVEKIVLLRSNTGIEGVMLQGREEPRSYIQDRMLEGDMALSVDTAETAGIVIGEPVARLLGVSVGDPVTAFGLEEMPQDTSLGISEMLTRIQPRIQSFHVTGIYETGLAQFDEMYVFTNLQAARSISDYSTDQVTRYDVTLDNLESASTYANSMQSELGFPILARSIYQVHRNLFTWVNLQKSIIPLVIGVIMLVAAFNMLGTLLIVILEKTGQIGILASLGLSTPRLKRVFLWLGVWIAAIGTAIGETLALGLSIVQQQFGLIPVPQDAYYVDTAPIAIHLPDYLLVAAGTLLLCALASYIPARVAARIEPIRSIRLAG